MSSAVAIHCDCSVSLRLRQSHQGGVAPACASVAARQYAAAGPRLRARLSRFAARACSSPAASMGA